MKDNMLPVWNKYLDQVRHALSHVKQWTSSKQKFLNKRDEVAVKKFSTVVEQQSVLCNIEMDIIKFIAQTKDKTS